MKVLIACEYSGTVREEFKKLGHEAWSCDILPTEIPGNHFEGNVLDHLNKDWDLIIAHPPCTYLSNAGACRLYPEKGKLDMTRYKKGLEAKEFFMQFYNHSCKKIVLKIQYLQKYLIYQNTHKKFNLMSMVIHIQKKLDYGLKDYQT